MKDKIKTFLKKAFLGSFRLQKSDNPSVDKKDDGLINEVHKPEVSDAFKDHDKAIDYVE
ncbi:MAG: hypothetical protein GY730_01415 [bacterium]|nr:hypothetical protein [bacterium]